MISAMTKNKKLLIGGAAAIVLILVIAVACLVNYFNTYVVIDGTEFRRDSVSIDLSGEPVEDLNKLKKLTGLKKLDLRDTGLTLEQYQDLQAALPECEIIWSVPFQDGFCSSNMTTLRVDTISEADFAVFQHLPELKYIKADNCTDYDVLMKLIQEYPQLQVSYTVSFSGKQTYNNTQVIYITDPNPQEISAGLKYLPDVTTVNFKGNLPEIEELIALQQEFPEIVFYWEFELFGVPVNTLAEFVDLSGIKMESTDEVARYIPCFYKLGQIDMLNTGLSNEELDALNKQFPDTRIVWNIKIWGVSVRTDAEYFMPAKIKLKKGGGTLDALKYCSDMRVLDFGHYFLHDVTFIEYMPKLEYLLLCENAMWDLSTIGNCTTLVTLELFASPVTDFWPLTNLTNLRNLNLCKTPTDGNGERGRFGDVTPLLQMTWLDRLWLVLTYMSSADENALKQTLSHTEVIPYKAYSSVKYGWRHSYDYYYHRDVMGMYYMI